MSFSGKGRASKAAYREAVDGIKPWVAASATQGTGPILETQPCQPLPNVACRQRWAGGLNRFAVLILRVLIYISPLESVSTAKGAG